jgi:hypothetical protein
MNSWSNTALAESKERYYASISPFSRTAGVIPDSIAMRVSLSGSSFSREPASAEKLRSNVKARSRN